MRAFGHWGKEVVQTPKEEPTVTCPVCKASVKSDDLNTDGSAMCWWCAEYLRNPKVEGSDHGKFMASVAVDDSSLMLRRLRVRPRGFWWEGIEVKECRNLWNKQPNKIVVKISHTDSYSSGGRDGSLDVIEAEANFAEAMIYALNIARKWRSEREMSAA